MSPPFYRLSEESESDTFKCKYVGQGERILRVSHSMHGARQILLIVSYVEPFDLSSYPDALTSWRRRRGLKTTSPAARPR